MAYSEIYNRINWENDPVTTTPLDAYNLNLMDAALKAFDICIKTIGNDAMYAMDVADCLFGQPTIDQETGVITFPKKDGGFYTLDTLLEKVVTNFDWDIETQTLTITLQDGTTKPVDLSALITENEFIDSSTIVFSLTGHKVTASIPDHSIGEQQLVESYRQDCEDARDRAETAAENAEGSLETVENWKLESEAWAVGTKDGVDVPDTAEQYKNSAKYWAEKAKAIVGFDIDDALSLESENPVQNKVITAALTKALADIYESLDIIAQGKVKTAIGDDSGNAITDSNGENIYGVTPIPIGG